MKILAKYISVSTQIFTGKGYYLGMVCEADKTNKAYNVVVSGSIAAANQVGYVHEDGVNVDHVDKPGVECTNGLYVAVDSNDALVRYSLG